MNKQININDIGSNNKVVISEDINVPSGHKITIDIKGNNNIIIIKNSSILKKTLIFINGNDNKLTIYTHCLFSGSI